MARPGNYLYKRKGSRNWHLRLQYPTDAMRQAAHYVFGYMPPKKVERSLGTSDRAEAELLAGPEILQHRRVVLAFQAMSDPVKYQGRISYELTHQPGLPVLNEDGSTTIATKDQVIHITADGRQTITPNTLSRVYRLDMTKVEPVQRRALRELEERIEKPSVKLQPKPDAEIDKEIVENWIKRRAPAKTHVNAGRKMLALFKKLHPTKTFATADREDALVMIEHMKTEGNLSATIKGRMSTLVAAVNLELENKQPRVKYNAFAGAATKSDDATIRLPLTEADVKKINARRDLFTDEQWLMWIFCQHTGMRPKEVYALREEFVDILDHHPVTGEFSSIRYVWISRSKTTSSTRKLPIPQAVLPLLPAGGINGPLFTEKLDELCRLINVAMQNAGVSSPDPVTGKERKVFYSARHRVKDRLLNAGCSEDIRKSIMGHSKKAAHDSYGQGFALWVIQPWMEYLSPENTRPPAPQSEMMLRQLIEDQRKEIEKIRAG